MKSVFNDNLLQKLIIVFAFWWAHSAQAQAASCSTTTPCVQIAITNPNIVPSPTVLWSCVGTATTCSTTALNAAIALQTSTALCPVTTGAWKCTQFSQTKSPQNYNDLQAYNSLVNYAFQGTSGGGVSAASPILTFQVPPPPAQSPLVNSVPITVTSGTAGPQ